MDKYDAYRKRLTASGNTKQQDMISSTKEQAKRLILKSPSISYVSIGYNEDHPYIGDGNIPCIASDDRLPNSKRFLFLPDSDIKLGDYVYFNGNHYLATGRNYDSIYPELRCELCNWNFNLVIGSIEAETGNYDAKGRPITEAIEDSVNYPCVLDTKVYSALSNEVVALPAGAMIIKMPYVPDRLVEINYDVQVRNMEYKVTEVNYENVINDVGFIEVNLQRAVNKHGFSE